MDPRKLMERLKGAAALTEQDVGEFSHFKGKMMKISVHSYAVEDWGSLSLLESRGMAGLMRRDMLVINSCVKDIPVLVIQYMGLFGRRMLQVHVLDVMKDKTAAGRFASLGKMAEQSGTAVQETPAEWYTPIQLPGSVTVTGKSSQLEQLAGDVAVSYLAAAAQVRQTGAVEGRYLRLRKLMSQLFDHGGFGYDAIRVCLQQQNTEELYSRRTPRNCTAAGCSVWGRLPCPAAANRAMPPQRLHKPRMKKKTRLRSRRRPPRAVRLRRRTAEPGSGKSWKKAAERPVFSAAFLANRSLSRMYTGRYLKDFFKNFIKIHKNSGFFWRVAV